MEFSSQRRDFLFGHYFRPLCRRCHTYDTNCNCSNTFICQQDSGVRPDKRNLHLRLGGTPPHQKNSLAIQERFWRQSFEFLVQHRETYLEINWTWKGYPVDYHIRYCQQALHSLHIRDNAIPFDNFDFRRSITQSIIGHTKIKSQGIDRFQQRCKLLDDVPDAVHPTNVGRTRVITAYKQYKAAHPGDFFPSYSNWVKIAYWEEELDLQFPITGPTLLDYQRAKAAAKRRQQQNNISQRRH